MSSHKKHAHLEKIKEAISKHTKMNEAKKSETIKHLEEWIVEDKAEGILYEELVAIAAEMKDILGELGLK